MFHKTGLVKKCQPCLNVSYPDLPGEGTIPSSVESYIVRSLKPFTEYEFTITPYLNEKKGVPANVTVKTLSDVPGQPPTNITLDIVNSTVS